MIKRFIIQFTHKDGNGWAIVNAQSPSQASQVFLNRTRFIDPYISNIRQDGFASCLEQDLSLVLEGAIVTLGKTPYDLAVLDGYEGTLEEWLASLKGEKGTSVVSIEETKTSVESGGINVITVTLSNGDKTTFEIRNGRGIFYLGTFTSKIVADNAALDLIKNNEIIAPTESYYKVDSFGNLDLGIVYTYRGSSTEYLQLLIWDNKLYYRIISKTVIDSQPIWETTSWETGIPSEWLGNNIVWDNLSQSLQDKINSATGVELVSELGDSEEKGITQKKITEELTNIKQDINDIIADSATINFTASPNCILVNTTANVSLNATSDVSTAIKLFKNDVELTSGSGLSLSYRDTVAGRQPMTVTYRAEFTFDTKTRSITKTTVVTDAVRYGAGMDSSSAVSDNIARLNPNGTYNINVSANGLYVWFIVPDNMTIHKATLSGFDFPLEAPIIEISDNRRFKVYRSSNTYDAGNLTIVIS